MYLFNDEKCFFDMSEGQGIVINFTNGMYYGFSKVGSFIVSSIAEGAGVLSVLEKALAVAGCPQTMTEDFNRFMDTLVEKEIVVKKDGDNEMMANVPDDLFSEGFALSVDEFAEVQDLLLADPIHDIDVTEGWPSL